MPEVAEKTYRGYVQDVFSGDDLVMMVDLNAENLHLKQRVRLHGVDTPNAVGASPDTEAGKVRSLIRSLTRDRQATVQIQSRIGSSWIAVVIVHTREGDININDELIRNGYAFNRPKA